MWEYTTPPPPALSTTSPPAMVPSPCDVAGGSSQTLKPGHHNHRPLDEKATAIDYSEKTRVCHKIVVIPVGTVGTGIACIVNIIV